MIYNECDIKNFIKDWETSASPTVRTAVEMIQQLLEKSIELQGIPKEVMEALEEADCHLEDGISNAESAINDIETVLSCLKDARQEIKDRMPKC